MKKFSVKKTITLIFAGIAVALLTGFALLILPEVISEAEIYFDSGKANGEERQEAGIEISWVESEYGRLADFGQLPDEMLSYEGLEIFGFVKPGSYNIPTGARMLGADEILWGWEVLYAQYQTGKDGQAQTVIVERQELSLRAKSPETPDVGSATQFRYEEYRDGRKIFINPIENQPRTFDWTFANGRLNLWGMEILAWEEDGKQYAVGYALPDDGETIVTHPRMLALYREKEK